MKSLLVLSLLFSCAQTNYKKSSPDCAPGEWQVFYDPYGQPVKRKITPEEFKEKKLWVDRIDSYQKEWNGHKVLINRDGEILINDNKVHRIEDLDHFKTISFDLHSHPYENIFLIVHSKNQYEKEFRRKVIYVFNARDNSFISSFPLRVNNAGLAFNTRLMRINFFRDGNVDRLYRTPPQRFDKILQLNPKRGKRYTSEYAPLSYQCEKN